MVDSAETWQFMTYFTASNYRRNNIIIFSPSQTQTGLTNNVLSNSVTNHNDDRRLAVAHGSNKDILVWCELQGPSLQSTHWYAEIHQLLPTFLSSYHHPDHLQYWTTTLELPDLLGHLLGWYLYMIIKSVYISEQCYCKNEIDLDIKVNFIHSISKS